MPELTYQKIKELLEKEKIARKESEKILEQKTIELFEKNRELERVNGELVNKNKLLTEQQDRIIQSEKMASLGLLSSGIAHEINNPIAYIMCNLGLFGESFEVYDQILVELKTLLSSEQFKRQFSIEANMLEVLWKKHNVEFLREDTKDLIKESLDGVIRVKEIVHSLKVFTHGNQSRLEVVSLNEVVQTCLKVANSELKYKATVHLSLGQVDCIECDLGQMNQVVMNLIINACHAIEGEAGNIWIRTSDHRDHIRLEIEDDGSGIEASIIDKIYDPFFTTKELGKGTGQGLYIVFQILKTHQAIIDVKTELGKGTTFVVMIPKVKKELFGSRTISIELEKALTFADISPNRWLEWVESTDLISICNRNQLIDLVDLFKVFQQQCTTVENSQKPKILVVDDVRVISKTLERIFNYHGYLVDISGNGIHALKRIVEFQPDVILLDISLPGCNGLDVIRLANTLPEQTRPKFIILSAMPVTELRDAHQYGVDVIMEKPFQSRKLLEMVSKTI